MLFKQKITHITGGVFLHTLKTLMAKLKVGKLNTTALSKLICRSQTNDWGALDREQNCKAINFFYSFFLESLASHRAEVLLGILPVAFAYGFAEINPDKEPLKASSSSFSKTVN
jgi:hypothetical protein